MPTPLNKDSLKIFKAALKAADGYGAVKRYFTSHPTPCIKGNLFLIGAGKASCYMAKAIEELFGDKITAGVIVTKYSHGFPLRRVKVFEAGHPFPDINGLKAAKDISALLEGAREEDMVLVLISGGGSALLPFPSEGIRLIDKIKVTKILLNAGADIYQLNTVRKHLSKIKGGGLARMAYPARVLSLIISDVVGDDLSVISSGLTAPDASTYRDAYNVIKNFKLEHKVPVYIINHIKSGIDGKIQETPKPRNKVFRRVNNAIIANNLLALTSAEMEARRLGYKTKILTSFLSGDASETGKFSAALVKEMAECKGSSKLPAALILGGETTVTVKGKGKGGRNQELALSAAIEINGMKNVVILAAGSDGSDGPTGVAGAIVDGSTVKRGRKLGMDAKIYLKNNDSYNYFNRVGGHIYTGPTGTNVMDIVLILAK